MVFSTPVFLFFFLPLMLALYWLVPKRGKNALLLLGSLLFYAWGEHAFVLVMMASIAMNWLLGRLIEAHASPQIARMLLGLAIVLNIGLLGFYKYSGFFMQQAGIPFVGPHLPLGISFFTFHALSYVIDVYRKDARAQTNLLDFGLYISFFPQLIAGPIIRYHDVCDQLKTRRTTLALAVSGTERFLCGLGKKMILANPLGEVADSIFALPVDQLSTPLAWIGIAAYSLQIYLDFSAYSDMAIGLARMFGFRFLENFNYPYLAQSMQDFWRRWHISLTNWFRDYLYIPLGGNRVAPARVAFNLILVFLACGLWHGANWTFIVWGAIHGSFLMLERFGLNRWLVRMPRVLRHLYVLGVVMLGWVFFRAENIHAAWAYLEAMAGLHHAVDAADMRQFVDRLAMLSMAVGLLASAGMFTRLTGDWRLRAVQRSGQSEVAAVTLDDVGRGVLMMRFTLLAVIALIACGRIAAGTYNPFLYFRF